MEMLRLKKGMVQVGDSKAFIIPSDWLQELKWKAEDLFYLEMEDGEIKIKKVSN